MGSGKLVLCGAGDKNICNHRIYMNFLGQHFTPTHIAELTLYGLRGTPTSILNPMAGHGGFLGANL